jgi:hypothetical protein
MHEMLQLKCEDWHEIAENNLQAAEVIVEMMIEADEDLCAEEMIRSAGS